MDTIRSRQEHPALHQLEDDHFYINARKLDFILFDKPSEGTIATRVRRFNDEMRAALLTEGCIDVEVHENRIDFTIKR